MYPFAFAYLSNYLRELSPGNEKKIYNDVSIS